MYNYSSLNDIEFEDLCADIMSRMLGVPLRTFAKGRDGGIDIKDKSGQQNIMIQVKHYSKSSFSSLKNSLKKEISKVEKKKPKQYYVCVSKELTADNILELYDMFREYMDSQENVITLKEIESFLQEKNNYDIVQKHFKLWLYSSNILSEIFNKDISIDCETLFGSIEYEKEVYVQTEAFEKSLALLDTNRIIMLVGPPGVGKTITSKMLLLRKIAEGYRATYTSNGNISDIKRALHADPNLKEIILLDDCLGQYYFDMYKNLGNELVSLIHYVRTKPNKLLIMNSRLTILNTAEEHSPELTKLIDQNCIMRYVINMDELSKMDKARILYNHFYAQKLPIEYFKNIKINNRYYKIIEHKNYNPRIIEYVTRSSFYMELKPDDYYSKILDKLNYPNSIWREEFENRHDSLDRYFMLVLFSLTDTYIDFEILKNAFEHRIANIIGLDTSIDNFERILSRLNGSLISIIKINDRRVISALNPSINDYLNQVFFSNNLELEQIRKTLIYFEQLKRCFKSQSELDDEILKRIKSDEIFNLIFSSNDEQRLIISYYCTVFGILDRKYESNVFFFLLNSEIQFISKIYRNSRITPNTFIKIFENNTFYNFYNLEQIFINTDLLEKFLYKFTLDEIGEIICYVWEKLCHEKLISIENRKEYTEVIQKVVEICVLDFIDNLFVQQIIDDEEIQEIVNEYTVVNTYGDLDYDIDEIEKESQRRIRIWLESIIFSCLEEIEFIDLRIMKNVVNSSDVASISGDRILELSLDNFDSTLSFNRIDEGKSSEVLNGSKESIESIFNQPIDQ